MDFSLDYHISTPSNALLVLTSPASTLPCPLISPPRRNTEAALVAITNRIFFFRCKKNRTYILPPFRVHKCRLRVRTAFPERPSGQAKHAHTSQELFTTFSLHTSLSLVLALNHIDKDLFIGLGGLRLGPD